MPAETSVLSKSTETTPSTEKETGTLKPRPLKSATPVRLPTGTQAVAFPVSALCRAAVRAVFSVLSSYVSSETSEPLSEAVLSGSCASTVFAICSCPHALSAAC